MFIATIHYRKKRDGLVARKTFVGVFATQAEAEGWVKAAFYGAYKNGSVYTDGGGKLHLTEVDNAFHIRGSLDLFRHENTDEEGRTLTTTCRKCHKRFSDEDITIRNAIPYCFACSRLANR